MTSSANFSGEIIFCSVLVLTGWGKFLCVIFDMWRKYDVGKKHVQLIDAAFENLRGIPCSLCVHNPLCGHSGCVEANGDLYSCDRYAFPSYYLGNILNTNLELS